MPSLKKGLFDSEMSFPKIKQNDIQITDSSNENNNNNNKLAFIALKM